MIFPERVFGRSSVKRIVFGRAIGPIVLATWSRSFDGHGRSSTRYPPPGIGTELPSSLTMSALIAGSGNVALPGFSVVAPGSGLIMMAPVSVCHHVSTTGQRPPPMCCQYQTHASGLIGSPTEPRSRRLERSQRFGYSSPHFMNVRIAVGAV